MLAEYAKLNGCYMIKKGFTCEEVSKQEVHNWHKDLAKMGLGFKMVKRDLEIQQSTFVRS
ncbi:MULTISPECIES: hypothetical protein [unclassified Neochlamydia]|uniref:hypothetical protein n=1 Tax=unclassified Neochlamydia TaxID=2643326 RepID=UPI001BC952C7|nr:MULTISPECIES: hypothetical protein [unclassified Neochlamydia]MBS4171364.1 hypothetical protein [Neochlamydia sp. AcF95]